MLVISSRQNENEVTKCHVNFNRIYKRAYTIIWELLQISKWPMPPPMAIHVSELLLDRPHRGASCSNSSSCSSIRSRSCCTQSCPRISGRDNTCLRLRSRARSTKRRERNWTRWQLPGRQRWPARRPRWSLPRWWRWFRQLRPPTTHGRAGARTMGLICSCWWPQLSTTRQSHSKQLAWGKRCDHCCPFPTSSACSITVIL